MGCRCCKAKAVFARAVGAPDGHGGSDRDARYPILAEGRASDSSEPGCAKISQLLEGVHLYELMGISRRASQEEIEEAYQTLASSAHPDKLTSLKPEEVAENFTKIQEAYELLSDPVKRKKYDRSLDESLQTSPQGQDVVIDMASPRSAQDETERQHHEPVDPPDEALLALSIDLEAWSHELPSWMKQLLTDRVFGGEPPNMQIGETLQDAHADGLLSDLMPLPACFFSMDIGDVLFTRDIECCKPYGHAIILLSTPILVNEMLAAFPTIECKRVQSLDPAASWDSLGALQPADEFLLAIRIIGLSEDGFRLVAEVRNGRHRQLQSSRVEFWVAPARIRNCMLDHKQTVSEVLARLWAANGEWSSSAALWAAASSLLPQPEHTADGMRQAWRSKPLCTTVPVRFWQDCSQVVPGLEELNLQCLADRTMPGDLATVLRDQGFSRIQ